jgi:hypothetical protein
MSALAMSGAGLATAAEYGQFSFENQTTTVLDFYVDDSYACRALAGLICVTQSVEGTHVLKATDGTREVVTDPVYLERGTVRTWTVIDE